MTSFRSDFLRAPKADRDRRIVAAWEAFVAAAQRAQRAFRIEDGVAAGKAWAAFLALFVEPPQREGER